MRVWVCSRTQAMNMFAHTSRTLLIYYCYYCVVCSFFLIFIFAYALAFNYKFGFVSMIYCIWGGVTGWLAACLDWCIRTIIIILQANNKPVQCRKFTCQLCHCLSFCSVLLLFCFAVVFVLLLVFLLLTAFFFLFFSFQFQRTPLKCWWFYDVDIVDRLICHQHSYNSRNVLEQRCIYIITIKSSYIYLNDNQFGWHEIVHRMCVLNRKRNRNKNNIQNETKFIVMERIITWTRRKYTDNQNRSWCAIPNAHWLHAYATHALNKLMNRFQKIRTTNAHTE